MSSDVTNLYDEDGALRYGARSQGSGQTKSCAYFTFFVPRTLVQGGKR
jgi:hypothetical protein